MFTRVIRVVGVAALLAGVAVGAAGSASAAPGAGTWSRITTPAHDVVYKFNSNPSATNPMPVSGTASLDVTSVDIDCVFTNGALRQVRTFASAVPVTAGHFSTTANVPSPTAQCRLRAIPTGVNTDTDYLGAFAGPLFFMYTVGVLKDATTPVGYLAVDEEADGLAQALNADQCGIIVLATVDRPSMEVRGSPLVGGCAFALPSANLAGNGSAIKVDGHNAYLPYGVSSYLRGSLALTLAQSKLTVTWHRASNGDMTVTESAPLMRCSGGDTYPPTSTSCPSLVNTRVTFRRVLSLFRGGHQARVRDTFTSTSGKHTVRTEYQGRVEQPKYGEPGYRFPGHGAAFHTASPSQVVSGLGAHAASMTVRTDVHAVDSDPQDDTYAYSWSRAPQSVRFSSSSPLRFAMPYTLTVPAGKAAYIGFAESEHVAVGDATKLANVALGEMVNPPTFSSPANGATITGKSVTVKGAVTLGANGLPRSVTVNGHAAKLSIVSATKETYAVTFTEALGKHTITATAKDTAGNTKTRSIKITNR